MKVDLASRALGGSVVAASDESFGVKERLIDPGEPAFVPGTYDVRGEVVDGWETRRHADVDWAIVRLGVGGRLRAIDVDTRFFSGNHPTGCRIDACVLDTVADPTAAGVHWTTIVDSAAIWSDRISGSQSIATACYSGRRTTNTAPSSPRLRTATAQASCWLP